MIKTGLFGLALRLKGGEAINVPHALVAAAAIADLSALDGLSTALPADIDALRQRLDEHFGIDLNELDSPDTKLWRMSRRIASHEALSMEGRESRDSQEFFSPSAQSESPLAEFLCSARPELRSDVAELLDHAAAGIQERVSRGTGDARLLTLAARCELAAQRLRPPTGIGNAGAGVIAKT